MKAMVLHEAGKPFVLETRPDPVPGPGEAVAKVLACGSGLTIHHVRAGRAQANFPIIIGHEVAGEIVAVGTGVSDFEVGDPVTVYSYLTCGKCYWCRINRESLCENLSGRVGMAVDGGYAEYIKLPARSFIPIPEGLDYWNHPAEAAVITDAIVTPYKVLRRAHIKPLETVAIFGAGGGIGLHMVMMARWAHARVIAIDIQPKKLEKCKELGADAAVDASQENITDALDNITKGRGVDVTVDFVSNPETLEAGVESLAKGGRLVVLGGSSKAPFPVLPAQMVRKELELLGSLSSTRQERIDALNLVARREVWPLVTETYRLEDAERVHARLDEGAITGRAAIVMR
jgi:D-arabinose 1-dehydrogenase-like Zn-dependent alcohol dehydrogenase